MDNVSFEDWKKLDLRVAEITDVQDHPNADKLYVLKINLGEEERTLVAGIRNHYTKDELLGKKIIVIANLEPAALRGVMSQGMLLAAAAEGEDGETVVLLSPEQDIANGAKVR